MSNYSTAPKQDAYETELASSIDDSQTTIVVADAPDFTISGGDSVYGVIDPKNDSREAVRITGISGSTLTVVRGIAAYEGGGSTATPHSGGATFIISDNWQNWDDAKTAINSKLDNDGGNTTTTFDMQLSGSNWRVRKDGSDMKLTDDNQSEVTLSTLAAGGGADEKAKVSSNDTTAGYLNGKLVAGSNVTLTENNDGANETLTIAASSQRDAITTHQTYTPAFLTGGTNAESAFNNWLAVLDGEFKISIDGTPYNISGIDFTGVASMADVATKIQTAIRAATSSTETVVWSTNKFIISSVDTTSSSAITVTSTVDAPAGTDISGAGAANWMDCDTGNGTVTNAVLDKTADTGKVVLLNASGDLDDNVTGETMPVNADLTAKGSMWAASAASTPAELTVGSNDQILTADSGESLGVKWATPTFSESGYNQAGTRYTYQLPFCTDAASGTGYSALTGEQLSMARIYTAGAATSAEAVSRLFGTNTTGNFDLGGSKEIVVRMPAVNLNPALANIATLGISNNSGTGPVDFNDKAVWFEVDASGNVNAKSADGGGSSEDTDITASVTETNFNVWEIRWDGTTATFYVNGTLLATHTTTVPTSGDAYLHLIAPFNGGGLGGFGVPFIDIEL